jgi:hypothetical protein
MNILRDIASLLLPLFLFATPMDAEVVHLRDGAASVDAVRVAFRPGALEVVTPVGETLSFTLDRVAGIDDLTDPILIDQWNTRQPIAVDVWRARTRLQRGDPGLALALFQRRFAPELGDARDHELALIISEGLLRCLIESADTEAILPAALETIRLRRAGITTDRFLDLPSIIDERVWLLPELPPIATNEALVERLEDDLRHWRIDSDPVVSRLAELYAAMNRHSVRPSGSMEPGVVLIESILGTRALDSRLRRESLRTLRELSKAEETPEFIESWDAWFAATSNLASGEMSPDLVVLDLLKLPAIHQKSSPILAQRAVDLSARILAREGREDESITLRRFLQESPRQVPATLTPRLLPLNDSRGTASNSTTDLETENE